MFSLFFGFGLALGAQIYQRVSHTNIVGIEDYTCIESHRDDLWYRKTPSVYWGSFVSSFAELDEYGTDVPHIFCPYSLPYGADVFDLPESSEYGPVESERNRKLSFIISILCRTH